MHNMKMSFYVCINRPVYIVYLLYVVYNNAYDSVHLLCIMGMIVIFTTLELLCFFVFKYMIKQWKKPNTQIYNKCNITTRCNLTELHSKQLSARAQIMPVTLGCGKVNSGQFGSEV